MGTSRCVPFPLGQNNRPPFGRWRRFDETRSAMMREALERIVATPGLSKDVFEQASKSLEG